MARVGGPLPLLDLPCAGRDELGHVPNRQASVLGIARIRAGRPLRRSCVAQVPRPSRPSERGHVRGGRSGEPSYHLAPQPPATGSGPSWNLRAATQRRLHPATDGEAFGEVSPTVLLRLRTSGLRRGGRAYTAGLKQTSASVDGQPRTYTVRATQVYCRRPARGESLTATATQALDDRAWCWLRPLSKRAAGTRSALSVAPDPTGVAGLGPPPRRRRLGLVALPVGAQVRRAAFPGVGVARVSEARDPPLQDRGRRRAPDHRTAQETWSSLGRRGTVLAWAFER